MTVATAEEVLAAWKMKGDELAKRDGVVLPRPNDDGVEKDAKHVEDVPKEDGGEVPGDGDEE